MSRILDLEKIITEQNANAVRKEIDREIMWSSLESSGWFRISMPTTSGIERMQEMQQWLDNTCQHKYLTEQYNDFIFENEEEAAWFKLRWQR